MENKNSKSTGNFVSFVLLDKPEFDFKRLADNLKNNWDIDMPEDCIKDDTAVFEKDGTLMTVSLMPAPVPNDEAVLSAERNFIWDKAVETAKRHTAHLVVVAMQRESSVTDTAVMNVKLCTECLKAEQATSINILGTVFEDNFYIDFAEEYIGNKNFPIMNLIYFGVYSTDGGKTICGYTSGMESFGKKNMEVINSKHQANEVMIFLADVATYAIVQNVDFNDGESVSFSEDEEFPITISDGMVKIKY